MPVPSQVCTAALPEHCEVPGVHVPVHTPPEHAELLQATGDPQAPVALHVSTPLRCSSHSVAPGAHDPVQAPPTHAWFEHVDGGPQVPVVLHVDTPLTDPPSAPDAHSVAPGEHTPWHEAVPTGPPHACSCRSPRSPTFRTPCTSGGRSCPSTASGRARRHPRTMR